MKNEKYKICRKKLFLTTCERTGEKEKEKGRERERKGGIWYCNCNNILNMLKEVINYL